MDINLIKRTWFGENFDGVVEAVRYKKQGEIQMVRAYQRRGPTWSDHVLMERGELLSQLKSGKRYFTGRRIQNLGSEFELGSQVRLVGNGKEEHIISGTSSQAERDVLDGVPLL